MPEFSKKFIRDCYGGEPIPEGAIFYKKRSDVKRMGFYKNIGDMWFAWIFTKWVYIKKKPKALKEIYNDSFGGDKPVKKDGLWL